MKKKSQIENSNTAKVYHFSERQLSRHLADDPDMIINEKLTSLISQVDSLSENLDNGFRKLKRTIIIGFGILIAEAIACLILCISMIKKLP